VRLSGKKLGHITAAHLVQLLHERVYCIARFTPLHKQRPLRVLFDLRRLILQDLSSFVGLPFRDAELYSGKSQLSGRLDRAGLVFLRDWVAIFSLSTDLFGYQ